MLELGLAIDGCCAPMRSLVALPAVAAALGQPPSLTAAARQLQPIQAFGMAQESKLGRPITAELYSMRAFFGPCRVSARAAAGGDTAGPPWQRGRRGGDGHPTARRACGVVPNFSLRHRAATPTKTLSRVCVLDRAGGGAVAGFGCWRARAAHRTARRLPASPGAGPPAGRGRGQGELEQQRVLWRNDGRASNCAPSICGPPLPFGTHRRVQ